MKRNIIIFATAYPYATAIITIIWLGSALLLTIGQSLPFNLVIATNIFMTLVIASIGFRK